eukprot:CAMPEP_0177537966 /NCGR_PEP_ID=MMETSP0369-20130122/58090_1 /TAXON_ID=447022 ORGANISM="Scrippsiella hangoei-like, Strain SHHI-4" /NCGR_SAMPLE_ID=MMETSP0369 /ASSEMBLY_ACC=CAM_ASM_000364 /LENGTH=44 /DNA_ID= /DNA_START= /DNA_END= /DNA_ORIENTATION=
MAKQKGQQERIIRMSLSLGALRPTLSKGTPPLCGGDPGAKGGHG